MLENVNTLADLKKLNFEQMENLANEIRELLIKKVDTIGGHMGPNLGFVEPTIAMHYVFNSPYDKFVFDVSHQCYTHKILTGRKDGFTDSDNYLKYSGYTCPQESEHDMFVVGHTSTSISLATGLAKGRDLNKSDGNIIAVIGDGSLSGGEAYEGLNNAAILNSNIIIVINDNEMSIAENFGGLYSNLKLLRDTNGNAENNIFKALGFEYHYVENGNNISDLVDIFTKVKDIKKPVVVHLHTLKGKGLQIAENNKEMFHWILPGTVNNASNQPSTITETYNLITTDYLLRKKHEGQPILAVTAGTPGAVGFTPRFRELMDNNYCDVGIAEEHAMGFISGAAKNGAKPVFSVLSSFVQRTYDQISQDLALNNSPATVLVNWGGISPADMTHLGSFDIPLISNIPNIVYLAPTCKEEYLKMLDWATEQNKHTVFIRVPFCDVISSGIEDTTDYSVLNKYQISTKGNKIAIIAVGTFFELGKEVRNEIKNKLNIDATLINPKFISGLDEELLEKLKDEHQLIITLESGILDGGFGQKIASYYGNSDIKVLNFGAKKEFTDRIPLDELYQRYHLTKELIIDDIKTCL